MIREKATLRQLWDKGDPTLGGWCSIPSAISSEMIGRVGFDWVVIDTQHGSIGPEALAAMLPAVCAAGVPAIVRVPWNDPGSIMKALDLGAQGVIVPMVNSKDEALQAAQACRYPPQGIRSWGRIHPGLASSRLSPESANRNIICAVMVETVEAVEAIEEILAVPGVDAIFVGPNDLALSAGIAPTMDPSDPEHLRLIQTVLRACTEHDVVAGIACGSAPLARRWRTDGFRMLAAPGDLSLMVSAAQALIDEIG